MLSIKAHAIQLNSVVYGGGREGEDRSSHQKPYATIHILLLIYVGPWEIL